MSMNSLDELEIKMQLFAEELERFNDEVVASVKDVQVELERLEQVWQQDTARLEHDKHKTNALDVIKKFIEHDGIKYTVFLAEKLMLLRKFLHP